MSRSEPSSSIIDKHSLTHGIGVSSANEANFASSAFLPPYRSPYLDSPYQDSPQTVYTSSSSSDTYNDGGRTRTILQKPITNSYEHDDQGSNLTTLAVSTNLRTRGSWNRSRAFVVQWFTDKWWIETICALLSVCCVLAIWILLKQQDTHPFPQWPSSMTLNAVISALATLAKALMAVPVAACLGQLKWDRFGQNSSVPIAEFESLDDASRGTWGSIKLLVKPKRR